MAYEMAAMAGASVLNGLVGSITGQAANSANIQASREARDWQEMMYNRYYSPQAMMDQYQKAGLNPYVLGQNNGALGQQQVASPQVPTINPVNPLSGTDNAINTLLQSQQLSINSEQAKADIALKLASAVSETYKTGGKKGVKDLFTVLEPAVANVDFDEGMFNKKAISEIYNLDMNSLYQDFLYETGKKYTPGQKQREWENLEASTKSLLKSLDVGDSQISLNQEYKHRVASEIAKNFADAFQAKKVGDYYEVSAGQMSIINQMLDLQLQDAQADFAFNTGVRKWKKEISNRSYALGLFLGGIGAQSTSQEIAGNKFLQYGKEVTNMIGNMFKVNLGLSSSSANIRSSSWSNFNNVTSGPSIVPIRGFE